MKLGAYFLIFIDNAFLLTGILKNPGIPQAIFDNYLKLQIGKGNITVDDEESASTKTEYDDDRNGGKKKE